MIDSDLVCSEAEIRDMYRMGGTPPINGEYIYKISTECDVGHRCYLAKFNNSRLVEVLTPIPITQEDSCKMVMKEYPNLSVAQPREDWPKPTQYPNIEDAMQRSIDRIEEMTTKWEDSERQRVPCEYLYWSNDGVIGGKVLADCAGNFRYLDDESNRTIWPLGKIKFNPPRKMAAPSKLGISSKARFLARVLENNHQVNNHDFWNNAYGNMMSMEVERYKKLKEQGLAVSLN